MKDPIAQTTVRFLIYKSKYKKTVDLIKKFSLNN